MNVEGFAGIVVIIIVLECLSRLNSIAWAKDLSYVPGLKSWCSYATG